VQATKELEEGLNCPTCKTTSHVITDPISEERICAACGVVVRAAETEDPGVNILHDREGPVQKRSLNSALFDNHGVMSFVGLRNRDFNGNEVSFAMGTRLRKADNKFVKARTARARSIDRARGIILSMCDSMGLPKNAREGVAEMVHKHYGKHLAKGRTMEQLVAVFGFIVCKNMGIMRTAAEFASAVGLSKKQFFRHYNFVYKELDLRVQSHPVQDYVVRICNKMQLPPKVERIALNVWEIIKLDPMMSGKHPGSLAGGLVYHSTLHSGIRITQISIARVAGVTEVSMRNNSKKLLPAIKKAFKTIDRKNL
jgi:transcription initiation factor TFIIB